MSDSVFPSGPWTGYYTYKDFPGKWRTDLNLTFINGRITGSGGDCEGPFVVEGVYDSLTKECSWLKTYVGTHNVSYTGFREGRGIWGTWDIERKFTGGFEIWPLRDDVNELEAEIVEQERPEECPSKITSHSSPRIPCP